MPLSRLRLRLAALFGCAFLLGLALLDYALFRHVTQQADLRLTAGLETAAAGLAQAIQRERQDPPGRPLREAVADALDEWPPGSASLLVLTPDGDSLGALGDSGLIAAARRVDALRAGPAVEKFPLDDEGNGRAAVTSLTTDPPLLVAALQSTAGLREDRESLFGWLIGTAPLVLLLGLGAGYVLARIALRPIRRMARTMAEMAPGRLERRLAVRQPPDELDDLAARFNGLLDRLGEARRVNRTFLARAAHQLRTPLTLVRGESEFGLDRPRAPEEYRQILDRIRIAAGHMSQRVSDLFLLAQADAGEVPPLEDRVEVDGLLLECVDLMRGRARATSHPLQFGRVEPAELTGNEMLLRESLLELIENACRHADQGTAIMVDGYAVEETVRIEVTSRGEPLEPERLTGHQAGEDGDERGLGLSIVRWIAQAHAGRLEYDHQGRTSRFALVLPRDMSAEPEPTALAT